MNTAATMHVTDEAPIFLCGALRSGTTLLRLMLDGHSRLHNPGELDFLFEFPSTGDAAADAAEFRRTIARGRVFQRLKLNVDETLAAPALARSFIDQLRQEDATTLIAIHRHFDKALEVYPQAKFIHLLRDPRDVAKSSIAMGWAAHAYFGVDHWIDSERAMERVKAAAPPAQVHVVRNEDLIAEPERELGEICRFLGLDYEPALLDYPSRSTYKAPDRRLVQQWRTGMTPEEIGLVEGKAGAMMTARGYELSGHPVCKPSGWRRFRLIQGNRIGRLSETVRRYGLGLTALEIIGRRLRIEPLRDLVAAKRNLKSEKFLK